MSDSTSFGDSQLGQGIGIAIIILALCFGIGGCNYLINKSHQRPNTVQSNIETDNR